MFFQKFNDRPSPKITRILAAIVLVARKKSK